MSAALTSILLRKAVWDDVPALERLIAESARGLGGADYTPAQIEAALKSAWGVDTQLIADGTYFVAEDAAGALVACGGWSYRKTLFGADGQAERCPETLDPVADPARIRAFFVRPDRARQGLGRMLLRRCEEEARAAGFQSTALLATLPGQRLYRALGYAGEARTEYPLADGVCIEFVPMQKKLTTSA